MIPKKWRDYTWQFRPLVVLAWVFVSPAIVLPLLWFWSFPWEWVRSLAWSSVNAPAWVQAVGSVVAIVAAAYFPIAHHRRQVSFEDRRVHDCLARLSENQEWFMTILDRCLSAANQDFCGSLLEYRKVGEHLKWAPHLEALGRLDLTRMNLLELRAHTDLVARAAYAAETVASFSDVNWLENSWREQAELIREFRTWGPIITKHIRESRAI